MHDLTRSNLTCTKYARTLGGGSSGAVLVGTATGILNFIGSALVLKFVPLLNFTSSSKSKSVSVFLIFTLYYSNMILLPLFSSISRLRNGSIDSDLFNQDTWYNVFGRSVYISMILTSFLPYIFGPFLGWLYSKCCKK